VSDDASVLGMGGFVFVVVVVEEFESVWGEDIGDESLASL